MENTANVGKDAARDAGKVRGNTGSKTSVSKRVVGNVLERGDGTSGNADNAEVSSNAESVTFNADNHTYWRGSTRIPGVSEILKKVGLSKDFTGISPFYAERGTAVHLAIQYYLEGRLDFNSLDDVTGPFFMAFLKYQKENPIGKIVALEKPMAVGLEFAGTPDLVTEPIIYDWKCSKSHDRVADLQGQAYKIMAAQLNPRGAGRCFIVVELHEDGTYADFDYESETAQWASVMDLYRWRLNRN